ncbi:MAG: glycosyltransferase family 2 protein [Bacteroidota bacterium]|nr:glycosyltransferase family 2 protein [Bacteroidota bacterium]
MDKGISALIPNWNGKYLLQRYLPSILDSLVASNVPHEVIVVDDASTDDSVSFLGKHYPYIRVIQNEANQGFPKTCNIGIKTAKYQWVLILNNDVKLSEDYVKLLYSKIEIANLFSVGGSIHDMGSGKMIDGGKVGRFIFGNFRVTTNFVPIGNVTENYYTFYNPATCCMYARDKLLALNGFDELFSPFNWEDTDIAYRAWKRGWISLYDPRATAYHTPNTTIGKAYRENNIYIISRRNKFFFHWKNLSDDSMKLMNILSLILHVSLRWLVCDFKYYSALGLALKKLPLVLQNRKIESVERILTDKAVLNYIKSSISKSDINLMEKKHLEN